MDVKTFSQMFSDKNSLNFPKLKHKFGEKLLAEYLEALSENFWQKLNLIDFKENQILIQPAKIDLAAQYAKALSAAYSSEKYGRQAMEEEILATLSIEQIDTNRESVRKILSGGAPKNKNEDKAYGIKRGLDFISNTSNKITAENLYKLYMLTVGDFQEDESKLMPDKSYRHDVVFVVSQDIVHQGLEHELLPDYIDQLLVWIHSETALDQIIKSVVIHYYFAYLHPYFDGNGRMARLLQLWYLIQMGYTAALFVPFSAYINDSKKLYYKAFTQISDNQELSKVVDVTPFIRFFIDEVFVKLSKKASAANSISGFEKQLSTGEITVKEKDLFYFVISSYGVNEFSTKQLEKDYRNVAYATVRSFVMKLESKGILSAQKFGNKVKYKIIS